MEEEVVTAEYFNELYEFLVKFPMKRRILDGKQ